MTNNKRMYAAAGFVTLGVIVIVIVIALILTQRGMPAAELSKFGPVKAEQEKAAELTFLSDSSAGIPGMKLAAESGSLALYYNPETTEVAVRDKRSDRAWFSNPASRQQDRKATPFEKENLSSQVTIQFRDQLTKLTSYTNFAQSVDKKQFVAERIQDGIRVTYTLGDTSKGIDVLPKYISKQRFEERVLNNLDEATAKYVTARYYPLESDPNVYERLDATVSRDLVLKKMVAAFDKAGYTDEDLAIDNQENEVSGETLSKKPKFVIPLEYRLADDQLLVTVPVDEIVEQPGFSILTVELMKFFGAAGEDEQGYMLVPDGTGSLIYLNNGKINDDSYSQVVYGPDLTDSSRTRAQVSEAARMPVYGMKADEGAWFAVIDEGDAIASINADVSGKLNAYNYVYSTFAIRGEDTLEMTSGGKSKEVAITSGERYQGNIQIRYSFLSGDEADYAGMAAQYRKMFLSSKAFQPLPEAKLPFYVDMIGAISKNKSFLGVPYNALVSMTTFEQAGEILKQLQEDGISNVRMRYLGWFNQGIDHSIPTRIKLDSKLGGKKGFQQLDRQLAETGGGLYPDVAFQHVFGTSGFSKSSDAARFITREAAERSPYNRSLNRMDADLGTYYLLSPVKLPYAVERFLEGYDSYDMKSLSLRDLGGDLHSDYRNNRVVHREKAKDIVDAQLGAIAVQVPDLMIAGGNAYAWPYASHLIDVPTSTSRFNIADEEVPFYQMVIHGYIDYAGAAVNLADEQNMRKQLLQSIELGAAPHFMWSYEPSSTVKFTRFDTMYSSNYKDWYKQAAAMYEEADGVLSGLRHVPMSNRIIRAEGVVQVKYENGASVYVNYNKEPAVVDGLTVGGQNYAVGGEKG
ncbi:DUF5696 domain-containing protein [Paenibacillus spongiae]|uniref:DUF5696 domain-containing protein n=1 Tax=Paenibacillus spongiae TaxID=2909671 RepID=A0ABY5S939_9BACL|nr:DUF5696 domain-containing protein [Paenibacillus spongiae]UVI30229.1 DUF5696 domain-containing protein [Paenibacillus spongiae]